MVYGLPGLKVHAKLALVVRREQGVMRKYLHLGTGNYNPMSARLYTDLSMFTCDEELGQDAVALFNRLTGYSEKDEFRRLAVAPVNLRQRLSALIRREIDQCRRGQSGHLIVKTNGLDDPEMMALLYEASRAGVRVDLLVRGICCLRPGIPGVSENIRVTSILGRFRSTAESSTSEMGATRLFLGSADLRPRNLDRRIEVVFPVRSPSLVRRLKDEILDTYLADNANAREMRADGSYERKRPSAGEHVIDSQTQFLRLPPSSVPPRMLESSAWRAAGEHLP